MVHSRPLFLLIFIISTVFSIHKPQIRIFSTKCSYIKMTFQLFDLQKADHIWSSRDSNPGCRMVGAHASTELWCRYLVANGSNIINGKVNGAKLNSATFFVLNSLLGVTLYEFTIVFIRSVRNMRQV